MADSTLAYTRTIIANIIAKRLPEKNVVMFHGGRSGSTVLGHLLNQNQNIFWDSEIFMRNRMPALTRPATRLLFSFPDYLIRLRRMRTNRPVYGFEVKLSQIARLGIPLPQFITTMKALDFHYFILLNRRNHLRIILSDLIAKQRGYWHQSAKGTLAPATPLQVQVNLDAIEMGTLYSGKGLPLIEWLSTRENEFSQIKTLLAAYPSLELTYEDHIERDPTEAYRDICNFIDNPPDKVKVQLKKTNPWPIKKLVRNYTDLASELAGSRYEWMLE